MNLVSNQASEALVDQLMPCQRSLTLELRGNDEGLEMVVIVTRNPDRRVIEAISNKFFDLCRFHDDEQASVSRGAQCKP